MGYGPFRGGAIVEGGSLIGFSRVFRLAQGRLLQRYVLPSQHLALGAGCVQAQKESGKIEFRKRVGS